ncbi:hypothetical protein PC116_g20909 [Phytophthora cactorum]|nr:hypothetical protein PC116_g20909 [Phytophthora cactorum]
MRSLLTFAFALSLAGVLLAIALRGKSVWGRSWESFGARLSPDPAIC